MAVSLKKGGNVSLTKEAPSMKSVLFGLGWDARQTDGNAFDLDASAFIVGEDGKVLSDASFIFFNNKTSACGGVIHQGDNRTGEGAGDDEQLLIHLDKVDSAAKKVVFAVTIYEADERKQNFGQVSNAFIRAVNNDDQTELARYDLSEDAATETAMIFGELYRHNDEWKFKAVGQGYEGGLSALAKSFGVNV
ncbi:TerD family protein [Nissabacter sp. SGAir0207]|uniref:TerD family protein n=1 Tax=Nissabacter sp. SGAir0207 TaxID=2126321 RepID=UPI0010CCEA3A|nr:TerD family protein [Nissabacter sp. SGAir0207]QCR38538.1 chemical-damaging agent resistance protein C [Nissabacter sp. SGAir0207]